MLCECFQDVKFKLMDPLQTINSLLTPGKGIFAMDASTKTMNNRLEAAGIEVTDENRRAFREVLVTTGGLAEFVSGAILYDETVRQSLTDGRSFIEALESFGIIPGIKVDQGLEPALETEEEFTKGLGGLEERLVEYKGLGLKFTKWRGVFKITDNYPSKQALEENLNRMSSYAKLVQDAGLVPIVEPEVLLDGMHTTTRCAEITTDVLKTLFNKLNEKQVDLTKLILKTNMVLPGKDNGVSAAPHEVAQFTLRTMKNTVPADVPGIVFLSGGQEAITATERLNEICRVNDGPWKITFSFERALEGPAMETWKGEDANLIDAQKILLHRAKMNSLAVQGKYSSELESTHE